jgi:hypothetical protein
MALINLQGEIRFQGLYSAGDVLEVFTISIRVSASLWDGTIGTTGLSFCRLNSGLLQDFPLSAPTYPSVYSAASILIDYWSGDRVNNAVFIVVCMVVVIGINMLGASVYGEAEFVFA